MKFVKSHQAVLFILLISLLPLFNLLTPGLPITHDSIDHIARIANFYQSLSDGNLIPRWAGNLNWGYGHPILMFLYPLPSYIASILHLIGISFIDSFKMVTAVSYILSGLFMFAWLRKFIGERFAILGSVLYLFAPYRFVDMYVRGDIGENLAFVFLPLVLFSIYKLTESKGVFKTYLSIIFVALSFAGLILSHNAISLLFSPLIIFYIFYLYLQSKNRQKLLLISSSLVLGLLFTCFFWVPAFFEGKYTLRDIVTLGAYKMNFVDLKSLIYSPWSFGGSGKLSTQIGIVNLALFISGIIYYFKFFNKKDKNKLLFLGSIAFSIISIFLLLPISNFFYEHLTILQKLQFPWRFLGMLAFYLALIGAILMEKIKLTNKNSIIYVLIILAIIPTFTYWHSKSYKQLSSKYFEAPYPGTTDTGESAPIWSVRFMEKFPKSPVEIIEGKTTEFRFLSRTSTFHEYILNSDQTIRIRENTLYFPGWKVYDNYKEIKNIQFQDPKNRGLITFYLNPGMHDIIITFEETKLRKISDITSLASILIATLFPFILLFLPKKLLQKFKW